MSVLKLSGIYKKRLYDFENYQTKILKDMKWTVNTFDEG